MIYAVVKTKGAVGKTTTARRELGGMAERRAARALPHHNLFGRQSDLVGGQDLVRGFRAYRG